MIIVFNGPPQSGKDQSCTLVCERMNFSHISFKKTLIEETVKYYGVDMYWFMNTYNDTLPNGSLVKDLPKMELGGLSRRNALIHVSEYIYKPLYGKDYFGVKLAETVEHDKDYCCSDGGFTEEIIPLINKVGKENVFVVQLTRDGTDFSKDSRRYLNANLIHEIAINHETRIEEKYILQEKLNLDMFRIHNNGSIDELYEAIGKVVREIKTSRRAA
jgi:hypothetical protein